LPLPATEVLQSTAPQSGDHFWQASMRIEPQAYMKSSLTFLLRGFLAGSVRACLVVSVPCADDHGAEVSQNG
jgi:hypothetical protein